jgi:hypothetical protein
MADISIRQRTNILDIEESQHLKRTPELEVASHDRLIAGESALTSESVKGRLIAICNSRQPSHRRQPGLVERWT